MILKIILLLLLVNLYRSEGFMGFKKYQGNDYERDDLESNKNANQDFQNSDDSIIFPHDVLNESWPKNRNDSDNVYKYKPWDAEDTIKVKRNGSRDEGGNKKNNKQKDPSSNLIPQEKCGVDVPRRIIGGSTTDIDEFPWLCLLQYVDGSGKISYDCSGVLISKRYVLTAAHCTNGASLKSKNMRVQKVRLGEWDKSTDTDCQGDVCSPTVREIEVEDIIPHEKYQPQDQAQTNDIALIRLREEIKFNQFVSPICLPLNDVGNSDYEGKKLTVSGWGRTSNARDSSSDIKMKVDLPVVNWDRCSEFYRSFYGGLKISKSQFCAGGEDGKDSCQGDSGGPLMTTKKTRSEMRWYVIGIVSSGPAACAVEGRPSLYTNVTKFTDWIMKNIMT